MGSLSVGHILFFLIIYLLFFGGDKMVNAAKSIGSGIREFKNALNEKQVPDNQIQDDPELIARQQKYSQAQFQVINSDKDNT